MTQYDENILVTYKDCSCFFSTIMSIMFCYLIVWTLGSKKYNNIVFVAVHTIAKPHKMFWSLSILLRCTCIWFLHSINTRFYVQSCSWLLLFFIIIIIIIFIIINSSSSRISSSSSSSSNSSSSMVTKPSSGNNDNEGNNKHINIYFTYQISLHLFVIVIIVITYILNIFVYDVCTWIIQ